MNYEIGDIVRHFKWETCTDLQKAQNFYTYRIEGFALDAETCKQVVVYRALYGGIQIVDQAFEQF